MGVFSSGGVGFDLGSANSTIYLENEGVVLREPSCALINTEEEEGGFVAFGREARIMSGRTPKSVELVNPVMNGAVSDTQQAVALINALTDKAIGKKRSLEKSRLVITAAQGLTNVETEALRSVIRQTGAKKAFIARAPIAAALGANLNISEPSGNMIVNLGAGVTDISVISMNGVVAYRSVRGGASEFDRAIVRKVRSRHGLLIGMRTAEDLKIDIGTVIESRLTDTHEVVLRGRDARTGNPATAPVTVKDVREALELPVTEIVEGIREAFENVPPELAGDILEHGIQLTGGGSLLEGIAKRIGDLLSVTVRTGEDPANDAAIGAGMLASDDKLLNRFVSLGSVVPVQ